MNAEDRAPTFLAEVALPTVNTNAGTPTFLAAGTLPSMLAILPKPLLFARSAGPHAATESVDLEIVSMVLEPAAAAAHDLELGFRNNLSSSHDPLGILTVPDSFNTKLTPQIFN